MKIIVSLKNIKINTIRALLIVVSLILITVSGFGQQINDLYDLLEGKDKKAVEKAQKSIEEAGKLVQEANKYFNEALELQSNYELDEKTLQKNLAKAEKNALDNQLKADKLYSDAYHSIYDICVKQEGIEGNFSAEGYKGSAEEMMDQAKQKRDEASGTKNVYERAALLNDAAGFENAAVENMILALQVSSGQDYSEPVETSPLIEYPEPIQETGTGAADTTSYTYEPTPSYTEPTATYNLDDKSENLTIDKDVVDKYDVYVNDPSIPDPVMVNAYGVSGVPEATVDQARTYLHEYQTGEVQSYDYTAQAYQDTETQGMIEDTLTTMAESQDYSYAEESYESYTEPVYEETAVPATEVTTEPGYVSEPVTDYSTETPTEMDVFTPVQSDGVRFMVQIAASRIPLSRPQVEAIFKRDEAVEVVKDGNWLKYRVTGFRLFSDANKVAINSGVRDAFVMSTNHGESVNLVEAREMTSVAEADVSRQGRGSLTNETDFYVQIAASRVRYSDQRIQDICNAYGTCREIVEEGWFKYQIYVGTDYSKAQSVKQNIGENSFIVGYQRGKKVNLYKVIH